MSLPADDLLSAFHDGAISAGEQATVERRLTLASAARQELSEIRQVSALVKSLPQESLPPEFPQHVLAAIEREMLVPSLQSDRPAEIGRRPRWVIGSAAVLTSAAGLLLMLNVIDHGPAGNVVLSARSLSRNQFEAAPTDLAMAAGAAPVKDADASESVAVLDSASPADATSRLNAPAAAPGMAGELPQAAGVNRVDANALAATSGGPLASELVFDKETFRNAQIGDVIEALQTEGNQVAVVRLTVVDRQEGLKELQLLLAKSRIEIADAGAESEKLPESAAKKESDDKSDAPSATVAKAGKSSAPDELLAVLVESNSEQLTDALQKIREANLVERLEVEAPAQVAELDASPLSKSVPNSEPSELRTEAQELSKSTVRDSVSVADAFIQATRRATPRRGLSATADSKKNEKSLSATKPSAVSVAASQIGDKSKQAGPVARQFALQVPAEALPQMQQIPAGRGQFGAASRYKTPAQARKSATIPKTDDSSSRPMQVLFVVDQAQSGSSATRPDPNVPAKARTEPAKPSSPDGKD